MIRIVLVIMTVVTFLFPSTNKEEIFGSWKVVDVQMNMPSVDNITLAGGKRYAMCSRYEFNADDEFTYHIDCDSVTVHGTWTYESEHKTITTKLEYGPPENERIDSIQGEYMWWTKDVGPLGTIKTKLKKY